MRSFVLVIFSALGLAGLFIAYWTIQPAPVAGPAAPKITVTKAAPRRTDPNWNSFRSGKDIWFCQYDQGMRLTSQFKGDQFTPRPDGTIHVINPVAIFFLENHQHLEVVGQTGDVVVKDAPNPARTGFEGTGPMAPPSRGRLDHVTVTLVDELVPPDKPDKQAVLIMKTRDCVFDNDTFRISTEGYRDDDGRVVADDQVPVHVTGKFDMEGRGLTVRWNDKDGRLELLEIAHGQYLKINDPSDFSLLGGQKKVRAKPPTQVLGIDPPLPQMLAGTDKRAEAEVITSYRPPDTRPRRPEGRSPHGSNPPVVYLARFYDNVNIRQADASGKSDQLLISDVAVMDVNFILRQSSGPTTQPTTTQPSAPATTQPSGPAEAVAADGASTQPAGPAATSPAPAQQPIWVYWTGVLRITPRDSAPPVELSPGDAAVVLTGVPGTPVSIHRVEPRQQGTDDVRCASAMYLTAGERAWFYHSPQFPQILINKFPAKGAKDQGATRVVSYGTVEYSRAGQQATLTGPGYGQIPLEPQGVQTHPLLQAAWSNLARFDFTQSDDDSQAVLRKGHFEGDVDIKHPKLALRSQLLDLFFDTTSPMPAEPQVALASDADLAFQSPPVKPKSQTTLSKVIATGAVWCQIEDSKARKQTMETDWLALDTAQAGGKVYARHVNAVGAVHAYADDDLRARYLDVWLKPAKVVKPARTSTSRPSDDSDSAPVELDNLLARGDVVATSKDASVATGDELVVNNQDGKQHTVLRGQPVARVIDAKKNVVIGPVIVFDSADGQAHVVGPGSMHTVHQVSATQPVEPVDVTWKTRADFDGAANHIDAYGAIEAHSVDAKGFNRIGTGEHVHIDLRHKSAAEPSTQPVLAAATQPAPRKKSDDAAGPDTNLFKDKEAVAFTFDQRAQISSTLKGEDGSILQQFQLNGPRIILRLIDPDGTQTNSVTVPAAGTMLVRDHRPPDKQASNSSGENPGGARGATGFWWDRSLVYSEAGRRADMFGNVRIVHLDEDSKDQPEVHLNADHVIAWFEKAAPHARKPAEAAQDDDGQRQLKYLVAEGERVVVTRGGDEMIARRVEDDPKRQMLIAIGSPRNPVEFHDAQGQVTIADRIEWDTVNWNPSFTHAIIRYRPPAPTGKAAGGKPATQPVPVAPTIPGQIPGRRSYP